MEIAPLSVEPPIQRPKTTEPYEGNGSGEKNSNSKGKAAVNFPTDNKGTPPNFASIAIPNFDLGISPEKEEQVVEVGNVRNKRIRKIGDKLRSPYLQRAVTFAISTDEKQIQEWVIHGVGVKEEPLFTTIYGVNITREAMQSLAKETIVAQEIIDGWVCVLNDQENYRSPNSPRRLFFTTKIALDWNIIDPDLPEHARYASFREHIEIESRGNPNIVSMREYDLVFFPVVEPMFNYIIVFNLKSPYVLIIDSEKRDGDIMDLYDIQVLNLVQLMAMHLKVNAHPKLQYFETVNPKKAELRWQTQKNHTDKGVLMMRNMEVYMGENDGQWETGLFRESNNQKGQLKSLRTKYVSKILTSPVNERKGSIASGVFAFMAMQATTQHRKRRFH